MVSKLRLLQLTLDNDVREIEDYSASSGLVVQQDPAFYNYTLRFVATLKKFFKNLNLQIPDYLNALEFGVVKDGIADDTVALQTGMNAAWTANKDFYAPAVVYLVTGLVLPGNAAGRTKAFRLFGQGSGEIFARSFTGGTIFTSVTDAPILLYTPDVPNTGGGNITIDHLRFEGNSSTPVVKFGSFYAQSVFKYNTIYQAGQGNGYQSEFSNTSEVHDNYVINRDWLTPPGTRFGTGFYIFNTLSTGLTKVRNCTSRGFKDAYIFGDGSANILYSLSITGCECSNNENGITFSTSVTKGTASNIYMEGGEGGTGFKDQGNYNTLRDSLIFPGFNVLVDSSADTYGNSYSNNVLSAGAIANTTIMTIQSSGAFGGPGKSVMNNHFVYNTGTDGVTGVKITGLDPRITFVGNSFDPRGPWPGTGTQKIDDQSTSSDGTSGSGVYGFGMAQSLDHKVEAPALRRGAINRTVDYTVLTESSVSGGILTLGELSIFELAFTVPTNVARFTAPNLPDKTFAIHIKNVNTTLTPGGFLKLAGSVNFTPGANGSWHEFQIMPGGIAYECSRIAY